MNQLPRNISSLEVAEMVGREHYEVLKDIRRINGHLGKGKSPLSSTEQLDELKIEPISYFIESTYTNNQNKELPCFLLTKKGCELYGTRMTGEKGTQFAVKYIERFNEMEEQLKATHSKLPSTYKEALIALLEKEEEREQLELANKQKDQIIGEMKPKADYTDRILNSKGLMTITQIAKDYGMSGQAMNNKLHEFGVQYNQGGQWLLYSKYHDKGFTHSQTIDITRSNGSPDTKLNTKWTQKGRLFLYNLLKSKGVVPVIERNDKPQLRIV